ncbi:MAG: dihydropteroate synthase [Arcanobacterium sp.]|nr:dihydropteroate synthase [Arcanobacterium sp.]
MGILNVTPDSFSDGGKWASVEQAIAHGEALISAGAEIVDIGGESTRPGATALSAAEEWQRIGPVVSALAAKAVISVDTYHSETARLAATAGAKIINDVTGGKGDPQMWKTVAGLDVDYILQHSRGNSVVMNDLASYPQGVVKEVTAELALARDNALQAGIEEQRIILDPGLGFAKVGDQDWEILGGLAEVANLGHRVLIGHSRKRSMARVAGPDSKPEERDTASAVVAAWLAKQNFPAARYTKIWAARVHNVAASAQAIRTLELLG